MKHKRLSLIKECSIVNNFARRNRREFETKAGMKTNLLPSAMQGLFTALISLSHTALTAKFALNAGLKDRMPN